MMRARVQQSLSLQSVLHQWKMRRDSRGEEEYRDFVGLRHIDARVLISFEAQSHLLIGRSIRIFGVARG
jgi:hypothetical protein